MTKTISYKLYRGTFPKGKVEDCIKWALNEWERELEGAAKFVEVKEGYHWCFSFKHHPRYPEKIARCDLLEPHRASMYFDLREKWATNTFQRIFGLGEDLRAIALHEIGHALGLEHVQLGTSIMNENVLTNKLDDISVIRAKVYVQDTNWY